MSEVPDPRDIDPNADRCPVCGYSLRWRGRHVAAKHPEWWAEFKTVYKKAVRTEWVPRD